MPNRRTIPYRTLPLALLLLVPLALWPATAAGQEEDAAVMEAWQQAGQPGAMHQHLAALVGTWEAETKFWMAPDAEPATFPGTIHYRMIMDGRFLEERVEADFMGQAFNGMGLYGYNNVTERVEATWIDDMSTGVYSYTGSINEAGDEIELKGRYMDPVTGEWKDTRSVMRFSDDQLHYISYETVNGEEHKIMEITGTRKMSDTQDSDAGS